MGTLLFNWFGYRMLYHYLQQHADRQLEVRLDSNDYNDKDLVEIKIPLHLPYIGNWSEFRRCNGEIDLNGKHYTYVKRRIYNDSLILLCIANASKQKYREAGSNYFSHANGLQDQSKGTTPFFKTLLTEYQPEQNDWHIHPYIDQPAPQSAKEPVYLYPHFITGPEQPPDVDIC